MLTSLLIACATIASAGQEARIGLMPNVTQNGDVQELIQNILEIRDLGIRDIHSSAPWSELEPEKGKLSVDKVRSDLKGAKDIGFRTSFTIRSIDTNRRNFPKDLMDQPLDSPEVIRRYEALVKAISPLIDENIDAVMLGNEVDAYIQGHPQELEPMMRMFEAGRRILKADHPKLRVGITTTYEGLVNRPDVIRRIQRDNDLVTFTYYPFGAEFRVAPIAEVPKHFDQMVAAAGGRTLWLQEVGYPSAELLGSSEAKQAAFVDAVFAQRKRLGSKLGFIGYFLQIDFSPTMVQELTGYYAFDNAPFRAFLGTLGLKDHTGKPRQAWSRFVANVKG